MRDDSGVRNGTGILISRMKPLVAIALISSSVVAGGSGTAAMVVTRISNLENQNEQLRKEISDLRAELANVGSAISQVALIQSQATDAQAYARSTHDKLGKLEARLIANGSLQP